MQDKSDTDMETPELPSHKLRYLKGVALSLQGVQHKDCLDASVYMLILSIKNLASGAHYIYLSLSLILIYTCLGTNINTFEKADLSSRY